MAGPLRRGRVLRLSIMLLTALTWTACATVPAQPPAQPSPCKLVETSARPCQPVVWLDGPAFELQRRQQLSGAIKALCASTDAGCLDLDLAR